MEKLIDVDVRKLLVETLFLALRRLIVGGGAVHHLGRPLRRHREGKADDARRAFV